MVAGMRIVTVTIAAACRSPRGLPSLCPDSPWVRRNWLMHTLTVLPCHHHSKPYCTYNISISKYTLHAFTVRSECGRTAAPGPSHAAICTERKQVWRAMVTDDWFQPTSTSLDERPSPILASARALWRLRELL